MFLCIFVLFCANKSILSTPEGHGIQEVSGLILHIFTLSTKTLISNVFDVY